MIGYDIGARILDDNAMTGEVADLNARFTQIHGIVDHPGGAADVMPATFLGAAGFEGDIAAEFHAATNSTNTIQGVADGYDGYNKDTSFSLKAELPDDEARRSLDAMADIFAVQEAGSRIPGAMRQDYLPSVDLGDQNNDLGNDETSATIGAGSLAPLGDFDRAYSGPLISRMGETYGDRSLNGRNAQDEQFDSHHRSTRAFVEPDQPNVPVHSIVNDILESHQLSQSPPAYSADDIWRVGALSVSPQPEFKLESPSDGAANAGNIDQTIDMHDYDANELSASEDARKHNAKAEAQSPHYGSDYYSGQIPRSDDDLGENNAADFAKMISGYNPAANEVSGIDSRGNVYLSLAAGQQSASSAIGLGLNAFSQTQDIADGIAGRATPASLSFLPETFGLSQDRGDSPRRPPSAGGLQDDSGVLGLLLNGERIAPKASGSGDIPGPGDEVNSVFRTTGTAREHAEGISDFRPERAASGNGRNGPTGHRNDPIYAVMISSATGTSMPMVPTPGATARTPPLPGQRNLP